MESLSADHGWCRLTHKTGACSQCDQESPESFKGTRVLLATYPGLLTDFARYPGLNVRSLLVSARALELLVRFQVPPHTKELIFIRSTLGEHTPYHILQFADHRFDPNVIDYPKSRFFVTTVKGRRRDVSVQNEIELAGLRSALECKNKHRDVLSKEFVEAERIVFLPSVVHSIDLFMCTEFELGFYCRSEVREAIVQTGLTGITFRSRARIYIE